MFSTDLCRPYGKAPPCPAPPSSSPRSSPVQPVTRRRRRLRARRRDQPRSPPAEPEDICGPLVTELTHILNTGSTACAETSDCNCYGGGMEPRSTCGRIANRATLARLRKTATRFRASACYPTMNCAAWACTPSCVHDIDERTGEAEGTPALHPPHRALSASAQWASLP